MAVEESIKTVAGIEFSILSPEEIRKYGVVEITAPETYDEDGMPVPGGLMDNRLGTLEPGQKCGTCGNTSNRCPGHFGYIELAQPVLHIAFANEIHKLLDSTCRNCGRLRIPEPDLQEYHAKLRSSTPRTPLVASNIAKEIIAKAKKAMLCPHCGRQQYEIEFAKPTTFYEITDTGGAIRLLPIVIRERLEKIPDEDLVLLGYNPKKARPEWFVLKVLPVPPVAVRPSITLESGIRSEDDLTHKIVDILRVNQRVKESLEAGTPPLIVQDLVDLLQYHVTTYFDNEVSGIPQAHHRSGRPLKTLSQRLKGKEGRFRGTLSGKRVDFSSRTVISPDPALDIAEVGVPLEVAKKLTVPEKVSPWNIEFLRQLVLNGPFEYPGANYVIRPDGVKIRLDYVTDRTSLANSLGPGYHVERHLMDGDIVLFNRQPSLHRMSVMAHFVKVLPYRTFRLHPAVCPPYNADFDGDEMNLHVPQGEEARSEALMLMKVQDQILSPRFGGPIIGAIRDFITAAYLLTKDDVYLTKEEFCDLASVGGYLGPLPEPALKEPTPLYTGKQLLSLFLPKDFSYIITSKWASGNERIVAVKDGRLIKGVIDKAAIGAEEPDSILHRIAKDYGTDAARNFLNPLLKVLREFLTRRGFTYGYDELELSDRAKQEIARVLKESFSKVQELLKHYEKGELKVTKGLTPEASLELEIMNQLSRARDRAGRVADRELAPTNAGVIMAKTGARGSSLNLGQMTACLGQQSVRGKRIEKGYSKRALSHYPQGDLSPAARGFVSSNYRDGLKPDEFFFHAMGGREGLVDTAVRTQQSGYMQRRLVNALEHLRVEYDLSVRDPQGNVIQFLYGEDGVDPAKSDHGKAVNVKRLVETEALLSTDKEGVGEEELERIVRNYEGELNPKLVKELKAALKEKPLPRSSVERVCSRTVELYKKALVEPGEAIGVIAAQSVGEPGTQMTLRTFHFAGVRERDVTLGLPRLIELVDARKIPSKVAMDIYLLPKYRNSEREALRIARSILFTKLKDIVISSEVDITGRIKLVLNEKAMEERGCTKEEVLEALKGSKRKVEEGEDPNTLYIKVEGADMTALQNIRNKLLMMRVKGIPGIVHVTLVKQDEEWMIQATGSNLPRVLRVEGVDPTRTISNNIYEIYQTLGIEAAREALIRELMSTLEEQGLEVDIRHIFLIADVMTSKGILQQIGRHGIVGGKTSVLARAAFEITVPTLADAAVKGELEELKGVTENVIVGLPIPVGTGMIDVFMKG